MYQEECLILYTDTFLDLLKIDLYFCLNCNSISSQYYEHISVLLNGGTLRKIKLKRTVYVKT